MINALNQFNSIPSHGRWIFNNSSNSISHGKRTDLTFCEILQGRNSLAQNIRKMEETIRSLNSSTIGETESSLLYQLQGNVNIRSRDYNKAHSAIYKFFMKLLGRDVDAAYSTFNKTVDGILRDYSNRKWAQIEQERKIQAAEQKRQAEQLAIENERIAAEKAEALLESLIRPVEEDCAIDGKYVPVDQTAKLNILFQFDKYINAKDEHKLQLLCGFIHLMPLAESLDATPEELLETLSSVNANNGKLSGEGSFYRTNRIEQAAIKLVEIKKQLDWEKDWKEILIHLYKSRINQYTYHGTNRVSLESIKRHGMGSNERDYTDEEMKKLDKYRNYTPSALAQIFNIKFTPGLSAKWKDGFYTSDLPHGAFIYGQFAPEWLFTLETQKDKAFLNCPEREELLQKYRSHKTFSLIQIKNNRRNNDQAERERATNFLKKIETIRKDSYECLSQNKSATFLHTMIFDGDSDAFNSREHFKASSIQYYDLPILSGIRNF